MTIFESRHGEGWIAVNCEPWDLNADTPGWEGLNCGGDDHREAFDAEVPFPVGLGETPDAAFACFKREADRFRANISAYRVSLTSLRGARTRAGAAPTGNWPPSDKESANE